MRAAMSKEPKKLMIYSTVLLADGGSGSQNLFTVPVGQNMPMLVGSDYACPTCGGHASVVMTAEHTNMDKAGELGSTIGDVVLTSIKARTSNGSKPLMGYEVVVSGDRVAGGNLEELLGEAVPLPRIPVAHFDYLAVTLSLKEPLKRPDRNPVFVKVEFWAEVAGDDHE
jgi:hypothetical protein